MTFLVLGGAHRPGLAEPPPAMSEARENGAPAPGNPPAPTRNVWPGVSLIALGATASAVGVYFVVTGGPPEQGEDRRKTLMRTPGFVIAGSGLAIGVLGALLLASELRKPLSRTVSIQPVVAPGILVVGISGQF